MHTAAAAVIVVVTVVAGIKLHTTIEQLYDKFNIYKSRSSATTEIVNDSAIMPVKVTDFGTNQKRDFLLANNSNLH